MDSYTAEQKEAMQSRSQWDKRKVWAKAFMDVVLGQGQDGDGSEYVTRYRIAMAAWNEFRGLGRARYADRRTDAFKQYMQFFDAVITARLQARITSAAPQPVEEPRVPKGKTSAPPRADTPLKIVRPPNTSWFRSVSDDDDSHFNRIGSRIISGDLPRSDHYHLVRRFLRALEAVTKDEPQGTISDRYWQWALKAHKAGVYIENGTFKKRTAS